MIFENIFTNFLAFDQLDVDHDAIAQFCYKKLKTDPGVLENQVMVSYEEGHGPIMGPLIDEVQKRFQFLHSKYDFNPNVKQEIINVWINLNSNGVIGAPHTHSTAMFSAVYYPLCSEGSGNLEFISPIAANRYSIPDGIRVKMNHFNSDMWSVKPVKGRIVFFPSWLMHFVRPNTDNNDRISIAFNSQFDYMVGYR